MKKNQKTDTSSELSSRLNELERTCFVIMPFGKKDVGGKEVNFNTIFEDIF
jgi:hypothetical protein